jgi:geranylgeranyl pyrophosphate synthase
MSVGGLANIENDGRADLVERKSCNLLEDMENCKKAVSSHCTNDEFDQVFSNQLEKMLEALKQLPHWDSNKCPAALHFLAENSSPPVNLSVFSLLVLLCIQVIFN